WLPQGCLPDERYHDSTDIDALTWVTCVLPQCAWLHAFSGSTDIPWLARRQLKCSRESRALPDSASGFDRECDRAARTAKLCLSAITDPPTARIGPHVFFACGSTDEFIHRSMDVCLREVEQIKPREWRAPSIWHATLWLRDLAAWNRIGRPAQPGLSKAFEDALPGPFLFRGQRNADWPLTPSILREPAL